MKIRNIQLTNFRCFESLTVDFHPQLTVLVTDNGMGKTAILEAVATGLGVLLSMIPKIPGRTPKETDFRIGSDGKKPPYMRIRLETENGVAWDRTERRDKLQSTTKQIPEALGYKAALAYANKMLNEWHFPLIAYYGTGRAVFETPQKRRNFKKEFYINDAYQDALDAKNNFRRFFEYFYELENYERREKEERRDWDYRFPQLETIREAISRMMPEFSNPHSKVHPLRFMVEWHHDDMKQTLRIDQLSDGFRTTLAMVMDIATRLSLLNSSGRAALDSTGIVLIDEIDLHLHPSWQQRILPDLMRTFPNIQFIVTTHSPQVLTSIPADCIRIIRDGQIFSAPPGTEGAESSRLLKRVQGVDIRPSNNEATRELKEYLALVDADQWDSSRAKELRQKLDARYQGEEPALLEADLQIENRKWELGQ